MLDFFFDPAVRPFSVSAVLLVGLTLIEVASALVGVSISDSLEKGVSLDHLAMGPISTAISWLNAERVPIVVLLMSALATFSIVGFVVQSAALHLVGMLPTGPVAFAAAVASVPAVRSISAGVARLIPRDESYVISESDLVGRTALVTIGPVMAGSVARAKVQDSTGNWHFPRVAPAHAADSIEVGALVLIVEPRGRELLVVRADARLSPDGDARGA
jgi:hypothetical protein